MSASYGKLRIMVEQLPEGLYESIESEAIAERLASDRDSRNEMRVIEKDQLTESLVQHASEALRQHIDRAKEPSEKIRLTNQLLEGLGAADQKVTHRGFELLSIQRGLPIVGVPIRPQARMGINSLITNAPGDASIGAELAAEISSADRIDILLSFVKWSGLRVLKQQLLDARNRGVVIRVLTTTYMGATERGAVDRLVREFNAEVRISYDIQTTRLHAKAWLFHRNTDLNTAYIGSSNLSRAAMVDGLEWNIRVSRKRDPHILDKFQATFDGYWNSGQFHPYDPDHDGDDLEKALHNAGAKTSSDQQLLINISGLEVSARPHQRTILEALDSERELHDHHRNLVVAATGTGKTVVAAIDFKNLKQRLGDPSLLFVAHRKEILNQSRRMFREVLADGAFGELYVDGEKPREWRHVFASIQGMSSLGIQNLDPRQFDVIVVDEFHRAESSSYQQLLDHFQPRELLGLTATPERADGVNVSKFFDGRIAAELRLWDALDQDLLVPFHYFGVSDDLDLRQIKWTRGAYDVQGLENLYTGNDARASKIINELRDKVLDPSQMRALGFCVSIAHAHYMARVFNEAGIPSAAVSSQSTSVERDEALLKLRSRSINCVFAVDLFNEGLDIPQVDTVLFLRPTQSATIFLQQLGRGLRRADDKSVLTVLDFVGHQRVEFRFDLKFRSLTGTSRTKLVSQIDQGFPYLPSGCRITLDRVAQQVILNNIRAQVSTTQQQLVADIRSHGEHKLSGYLRESGRDLADIYKRQSWTALSRLAGFDTFLPGPGEEIMLKRVRTFAHVDDPARAESYAKLISKQCAPYEQLTSLMQTYARMLIFTVWPDLGGHSSFQIALEGIRANPAVCDELRDLLAMQIDITRNMPRPLAGSLGDVPVYSHATYKREEILAALGYVTSPKALNHREGVAWCEPTRTDAFLVTLHKTDSSFTETTSYKDYAISPTLFHWESQSTTTRRGKTGQRYLNHDSIGTNVVLFTRETPDNDLGGGAPYICLGTAKHVSDSGEKPITITWRLDREMPTAVFATASAVAI